LPDTGDVRQDPTLPKRAGDSDAVMPIQHVVLVAALVKVDRVHAATAIDVGGDPPETRPRQLRCGPEMTVEAPGGLDRSDDVIGRHSHVSGPRADDDRRIA
jgi:hypothetical protein